MLIASFSVAIVVYWSSRDFALNGMATGMVWPPLVLSDLFAKDTSTMHRYNDLVLVTVT